MVPKIYIFSILIPFILFLIINKILYKKESIYETIKKSIIFMVMVTLLSLNYMLNLSSGNVINSNFETFEKNSEVLVTSAIFADKDKMTTYANSKYGLQRYIDVSGYVGSEEKFITNDYWLDGYSRTFSGIIISHNDYSSRILKEANFVKFSNGDILEIESFENTHDDKNIYKPYFEIKLSGKNILSSSKNGELSDIVFLDYSKEEMPSDVLIEYESQFGLQGFIFRAISKFTDYNITIKELNVLCGIITALTMTIIVFLMGIKYNLLLAVIYYLTFLLSPWIVNFARNLYWVEFTWFIPMAIGLFCSININNKICRFISYLLAFFSILIKCLCGYEYISTIMLSMITFLVIDFIVLMFLGEKDKTIEDSDKKKLLFNTIFILGISALLGFVVALSIHGSLRGDGDIIKGVISIYNNDIVRRTFGETSSGMLGNIPIVGFIVECCIVVIRYFIFGTEIITGIPGIFFIVFATFPILFFIDDFLDKKINIKIVAMYLMTFIGPISWFILAKNHSMNHTHLSFVLWYFGFIQSCIYIIIIKIIYSIPNIFKKIQEKTLF